MCFFFYFGDWDTVLIFQEINSQPWEEVIFAFVQGAHVFPN